MSTFKSNSLKKRGFTIIELIVSVTIFALMTTLVVSKYGSFNQTILLTNLAYDVALTIRNAQTYGLNVKSRPTASSPYTTDSTAYQYAYGVHFDKTTTIAASGNPYNRQMIFFSDIQDNQTYTPGQNEEIATYVLKGGSVIDGICVKKVTDTTSSACTESVDSLSITYKRPDPDAIFTDPNVIYAEITVKASNGLKRTIGVRKEGQIIVYRNK
jgi:prepilin-type N-terminal cleavage/methylation domain-containing protein